jgi:NAD(P)-dependent dehydrogenase (short-subunit alcohol dehydrogenase family)
MQQAPDPLFDVSGKVILVTGASSGIGLHLSTMLAARGAHILAVSRSATKNSELKAVADRPGGSLHTIDIDVSSEESVEHGIAAAARIHGRIDVVINNAGNVTPKRMLETTHADWLRTLETNLSGPFLVMRAATPFMPSGSAIIQIASIGGFRAIVGLSAYAASKSGLAMLSRSMALELAERGIRVNTIVPGYVVTPMNQDFLGTPAGERLKARIPAGRFAQPADLDGAILFLASIASSYVTGACLAVDGGYLA